MRPPCKLFFAADVGSTAEAIRFAHLLAGLDVVFKIGLRLFTAEGPSVVRAVRDCGFPVFLDLKLHDVPKTVSEAAMEAAKLGVQYLTVHAEGGRSMMENAVRGAGKGALFGSAPPLILAVTVLTSLNEGALAEVGPAPLSVEQVARQRAQLAKETDCGGVIASPQETRGLRDLLGPKLEIITPGIRGPDEVVGDQTRIGTADQAREDGASGIVVGRGILNAADPRAAVETLLRILTA